jgi:diketogulonate reductase-like aldo/keto reductase
MKIPPIIYGTAWKKDQTSSLVVKAITAGFRGVDTAAQPKHYQEEGVGEALRKLESQGISRQQLFLQTKFTPVSGQDPEQLPYDPRASLPEQVAQSFLSSQKNLGTDYVDSLVLHSPLARWNQMMEVWKAMENIHQQGGARMLGISNCYELDILEALYDQVQVKPRVLQNRFYQDTSYDLELRRWCHEKGITYQSFWTLTGNPHILGSDVLHRMAQSHHKSEAQIFFRFVTQLGIVPLTGTRSDAHMKEDLEIFSFELSTAEMDAILSLIAPGAAF